MLRISVKEKTFLDCSTGWFVTVDGMEIGGELYSLADAETTAKTLCDNMNQKEPNSAEYAGSYKDEFSCLFGL